MRIEYSDLISQQDWDWRSHFMTLVLVAAALLIAYVVDYSLKPPNLSIIFIFPVLISAFWYGLLSALTASILSVLSYNFFLTEPRYSFVMTDPGDWLALSCFLAVSLIMAILAAGWREQKMQRVIAHEHLQRLYTLAKDLTSAVGEEELGDRITNGTSILLDCEAALISAHLTSLPKDRFPEQEMGKVRFCAENRVPVGRGTEFMPGSPWRFDPIIEGEAVHYILATRAAKSFSSGQTKLLSAILDLLSSTLYRERLRRRVNEDQMYRQSEKLRSAVLNSISHDFRSPLATIIGHISALRSFPGRYEGEKLQSVLTDIDEHAQRLNRYIGNLLALSRWEAGQFNLDLHLTDLSDLTRSILAEKSKMFPPRDLEFNAEDETILVKLDVTLFELALVNVLDNAVRHTDPGGRIKVSISVDATNANLCVTDDGDGLPTGISMERLFERFWRGETGRGGVGLGLAITQIFVEALGGQIQAANRTDQSGAEITLSFPRSGS